VWNHGKVPSLGGETRGFYLILGPRELSAAYRYIYGPARAVKGLSSETTHFGIDAVIYPASE
jgi:hypothetical protein